MSLLHALISPGGLATYTAAAPYLSEITDNTKKRYIRTARGLMEMPFQEPGETDVNVSAFPFVEKKLAEQRQIKTADASLGDVSLFNNASAIGGSLLGLNQLAADPLNTWSYKLRRMMFPGVGGLATRVRADEQMAKSFIEGAGRELGKSLVNLFSDMTSKAVGLSSNAMMSKMNRSVFETLQKEDPVLSGADPQALAEAYHTMSRFAPMLATDKNAVKAFLRESVTYGTGPNHVAIKQLADAEQAVNKALNPK